jgi:multidrug efflux pump subunit AcrA (membrane-fusion protein)
VDRWDGRTILLNRQIYRYRGPLILAAQALAAHAELVALDRARILVEEERERLDAQADLDAALGLIDRGNLSAEDLAAVRLLLP